ncbi:MAG: hypothetical protein P1V51_03755 [Deltaproteobacteria bacterium]|nr:hypothetical protein [Deltaproteobacteria bacterium]
MASKLEERVLTHRGRQHFRKTYSRVEVRYSLAVFLALGAITAWVAWRGAHPDPTLFEAPVDPGLPAAAGLVDRGPLPEGLAPEGFAEQGLGSFDAENLYVKINGREGYFKAFGFQHLWAATLVASDAPERTIELELYDLGRAENAAGALSGELPEGAEPRRVGGDLAHLERNALLLTRGKHFLRAIGSDEGAEVKAALAALEATFSGALEGAERPWSQALFEAFGAGAGDLAYYPESAFSFGFAREVHAARLADGSTELFVHRAGDEAAAATLARQFHEGFLQYGEAVEGSDHWVKDRYLGEVSGAVAEGRWVIGVRTAPDLETAEAQLGKLREEVGRLAPLPAAAAPVAPEAPAAAEEGYE